MDAYLFDLGNVLVGFDHRRFCRRFAVAAGRGSEEEIYHSVLRGELSERFERGEISGEDFYRKVSEKWAPHVSMDRFRELWCDIFWENPGMEDLVARLKGPARLILVSNTNAWHMESILERIRFLESFDARVLSYEVGARKPDTRIFEAALAAAAARPERCMYFDDLEENIEAARRLGIHGVLFRYQETCPRDSR